MYFLGIMHMNGEGFPVDYDRALTWFNMAATTNDMTIRDQAREVTLTHHSSWWLSIRAKHHTQTDDVQAVEFLSASMAEARMTMQIIRNKFDPQHADFDPDFERGRPYKVCVSDRACEHKNPATNNPEYPCWRAPPRS